MNHYKVTIDAPVSVVRSAGGSFCVSDDVNPTRSQTIVAPGYKRSVAVARALRHWEGTVGKGCRRMIVVDCTNVSGRIIPDSEVDVWLDKHGKRVRDAS